MLGLVAEGKAEIDAAADKPAVDAAVETAEQAIDDVPQKEAIVGGFYSLDEAYNNGWLSQEDLRSIAYYYSFTVVGGGSNNDENFVPKPKDPEILDESTAIRIKQEFVNDLKKNHPNSDITLDNAKITRYYGVYGNCVVLGIWTTDLKADLMFIPEYYVGGVLFLNYCGSIVTLYVWIAG